MTASLCIHEVDPDVRVTPLDDMPESECGAPMPAIIGDEQCIVLGYGTPQDQWAIVRFDGVSTHAFGSPNDEAIHGHPLYAHGLTHYGCFEVTPSPWLRRLEIANRVHDRHDAGWFMSGKRHFILAFHDSLFECVARSYRASVIDPEKEKTLDAMIRVWKEPRQG